MFLSKFKNLIFGALLIVCTSLTTANAVVIELALVLDGSGSIDSNEFTLQTGAYRNIFNDNFVTNYVNPADTLYVAAYQFSTADVATLEIGWTMLGTDAAAAAFGNMFPGITQLGGSTNTSGAVNTAVAGILGNGIAGDRLVIDVSTDGQPTAGGNGPGAITAATNAQLAGVTVNAIGVGNGIGTTFLENFTEAGDGFFETADDFVGFEVALARKIRREVAGDPEQDPDPDPEQDPVPVPEPTSVLLLGIGMLGLTAARKKKLM